jgi:hypothetical protein
MEESIRLESRIQALSGNKVGGGTGTDPCHGGRGGIETEFRLAVELCDA